MRSRTIICALTLAALASMGPSRAASPVGFRQFARAIFDDHAGTRISVHAILEGRVRALAVEGTATTCIYLKTPTSKDGGCGQVLLTMDPLLILTGHLAGQIKTVGGSTYTLDVLWLGGTDFHLQPIQESPRAELRWSRNATSRIRLDRGDAQGLPTLSFMEAETTDAGLWQTDTVDPFA